MNERSRIILIITLGFLACVALVACATIASVGRDIPPALTAAVGVLIGAIVALVPPAPRNGGFR